MKVLYVVMARGGSKGVPRKNICEIGGIPLIAYKIIAAQRSDIDKRIIVSTDDEKIADIARKYGAEVPFMRPDYLASDSASSMDVIEHAMNWIQKNDSSVYDYVCMLEPSSPFADYMDFNIAFQNIIEKEADTLLGMVETEINTVFIHSLDEAGGLSEFYESIKSLKSVRRQDQKCEYTMNGCMYIAKWDYFVKNKLFHSINSLPYIMPREKSIEIDSMLDLEFARMLVEKKIVDITPWK